MELLFGFFLVQRSKTHGVKKILVEIAKQILSINLNLTIGKTNLTEYLEK